MVDAKAKLESKAKRLIKSEYVIWLTTIGSDLAPQPRPVWFIWDKDAFLIFSQANAHKLKHIEQRSKVALHFNTDIETGDQDVVIYSGEAEIVSSCPPAHKVPGYLRKYRSMIKDMNMTPEQFSREYSVAIRVKPTSLRGW